MTIFIKSILLFCAIHLLSLFHTEVVHREGVLLCKLKNLPHRGTGFLFFSYMKHPYRGDFLRDYAKYYLLYVHDEMLLEGMKRPVVPMLIVRESKWFPKDRTIQDLRGWVMQEHFRKLEEDRIEPKIEVIDMEETK